MMRNTYRHSHTLPLSHGMPYLWQAPAPVLGELALPIGGIMSRLSVQEVDEQLEALKTRTRELGISSDIDPFMTLAFVSLPVIPKLRINTYGIIDVDRQAQVPSSF